MFLFIADVLVFIIKPFHSNPKLVIKHYVFGMHAPFTGVDYYYNDAMRLGMSKYFL